MDDPLISSAAGVTPDSPARRSAPPWLTRACGWALGAYWVALATATHWPGLDLGRNDLGGGVFQVDKVMHAGGFGLLMAMMLLAMRPRTLAPLALAVLYALVDEYTQQWVQRQVSSSDLAASLIGILAVWVVWRTPRRQAVGDRRGWRIVLTRLAWVAVAPTLTLLVTLPTANPLILRIVGLVTVPQRGVDHWLHFWLAMGLTWLLAAAAPAGRRRPRLGAAVTIALMAAAAPVIELVQKQTGRGFEVADVYAHQLGLLAALVGWTVLVAWRNRPWAETARPRAAPPDGSATAAAAAPAEPAGHRFVGHAVVVSALTLLSRMTGLARDAVLAAIFGLSPVADAFFIGFLVPNLFRRLFGEGALSAAFIPHYTDLLKRDPALARRFASLCLTLLAVLLCALTLVGELILWWMSRAGSGESLAIRLTMVMLPYMPLICLVALIGGVLQVHRRFGPPAAAPVVLNVVMIAAAAWSAWGAAHPIGAEGAAVTVAVSVLAAGVLQLLWQGAIMLRHAALTVNFAGAGASLRSMLVMMLPMLVGLAVFQINAFMDSLLAFVLSATPQGPTTFQVLGRSVPYPMDSGAVAALQWAQRLYQFPLGVFGIAIATAIFPALAAAVRPGAAGELASERGGDAGDAFARILRQGLRLTVFIGLPASVGLIILRLPLARLVYERGAFSPEDSQRVATILAGYATSIWAYSMTHVLTRGFYALKDARTPLRISLVMVGFNLALNLILIWPLGAAGLAWSTAISAMGQVALLLAAIRGRVASPVDATVLRGWGRTALLSAVMAGALLPLTLNLDMASLDTPALIGALAGLVTLGGAIIFGGAWLIGAEELAWLKHRRSRRG